MLTCSNLPNRGNGYDIRPFQVCLADKVLRSTCHLMVERKHFDNSIAKSSNCFAPGCHSQMLPGHLHAKANHWLTFACSMLLCPYSIRQGLVYLGSPSFSPSPFPLPPTYTQMALVWSNCKWSHQAIQARPKITLPPRKSIEPQNGILV